MIISPARNERQSPYSTPKHRAVAESVFAVGDDHDRARADLGRVHLEAGRQQGAWVDAGHRWRFREQGSAPRTPIKHVTSDRAPIPRRSTILSMLLQ